jgi:hypothetical protein
VWSIGVFGIRKNCLISGRSLLLYQFTGKVIEMTVVIMVDITAINFVQHFNQYSSLKVKSIDEIIGDHQCGF